MTEILEFYYYFDFENDDESLKDDSEWHLIGYHN